MPDFTMCKGTGCPLAKRCYRTQAVPSEFRQSYFVDPPFNDVLPKQKAATVCAHFWDVNPTPESEKQ